MGTIIKKMTQVWVLESGQPWLKFPSDLGSVNLSQCISSCVAHGYSALLPKAGEDSN